MYTPEPPGTPTYPGWWTKAYNAVRRMTTVIGGPGITVTRLPTGEIVIGLSGAGPQTFEARITEAPAYAPTDPAACVYGYAVFGRPGMDRSGVTPEYGRPTRENEWMLWPAKVGERCFVVRTTESDGTKVDRLWVMTEAISRRPCGGGG